MAGPFVHAIDPVITQVGPVYLWWYGASYTVGFLLAFWWARRVRAALGLDPAGVWLLAVMLSAGVLLGGRAVEVVFYEWAYYGRHPWHIPAVWLGGMSTHGILLGAILAVFLFARLTRGSFLAMADELAVAGALIMGLGRLGNFVDGQISGGVTDVWWAVKFPDLDGFRHPVVLYDGVKNLLLVPLLLLVRSRRPPRGVVFGHFVLWYGFLRFFVDFFREYRMELVGLPPGQEFNLLMTVIGVTLIMRGYRRRAAGEDAAPVATAAAPSSRAPGRGVRAAFLALLAIPLVIPSDWTQDVPARYGQRHPGMVHSSLYPAIASSPADASGPAQ